VRRRLFKAAGFLRGGAGAAAGSTSLHRARDAPARAPRVGGESCRTGAALADGWRLSRDRVQLGQMSSPLVNACERWRRCTGLADFRSRPVRKRRGWKLAARFGPRHLTRGRSPPLPTLRHKTGRDGHGPRHLPLDCREPWRRLSAEAAHGGVRMILALPAVTAWRSPLTTPTGFIVRDESAVRTRSPGCCAGRGTRCVYGPRRSSSPWRDQRSPAASSSTCACRSHGLECRRQLSSRLHAQIVFLTGTVTSPPRARHEEGRSTSCRSEISDDSALGLSRRSNATAAPAGSEELDDLRASVARRSRPEREVWLEVCGRLNKQVRRRPGSSSATVKAAPGEGDGEAARGLHGRTGRIAERLG